MEFYTHEVDRDLMVVAIDGGLDGSTIDQFRSGVEQLLEGEITKVIIDAENLRYVSSLGVGELLTLHRKMKKRGGDVKIASLHGVVFDILRLAKLDSLFEIYDDLERARLAFRPKDAEG